jgi:hypothetical protein
MSAVAQSHEESRVIKDVSWEAGHVWKRLCSAVRSEAEGPVQAGFPVALHDLHVTSFVDEAIDELVWLGVVRRATVLEGDGRAVKAVKIVEGHEDTRVEGWPCGSRDRSVHVPVVRADVSADAASLWDDLCSTVRWQAEGRERGRGPVTLRSFVGRVVPAFAVPERDLHRLSFRMEPALEELASLGVIRRTTMPLGGVEGVRAVEIVACLEPREAAPQVAA